MPAGVIQHNFVCYVPATWYAFYQLNKFFSKYSFMNFPLGSY